MGDFIVRPVVKNVEAPGSKLSGEPERVRYEMIEDVLNYQGVSLIKTQQALWKALQDVQTHVTNDNSKVRYYFDQLATFPFQKVVDILTDHMRNLIRQVLTLRYFPYTQAQSTGIDHLTHTYPIEKQDYELIKRVKQTIPMIMDEILAKQNPDNLTSKNGLGKKLDVLLKMVYDVPEIYLWTISGELDLFLKKIIPAVEKDNRIDTMYQYLQGKSALFKDKKDFNSQLVEDITSTMSFLDPHPEVMLALEKGQKVLHLFYTPAAASKLFINDIESKIQRYLDMAKAKLDPRLIAYFRDLHNPTSSEHAQEEKLTVEERYKKFVLALDRYRATGEGLQHVLEMANLLRNLPYHEVSHLPGFTENIRYAMNLTQTTLPLTQENNYLKVTAKYPIIRERIHSDTVGSTYRNSLDKLNQAFNQATLGLSKDIHDLSGRVSTVEGEVEGLGLQQSKNIQRLDKQDSRIDVLDNRAQELESQANKTNVEVKTLQKDVEGLTEKVKPLDHVEDVADFEGNVSFTVFSKSAFHPSIEIKEEK